MRTGLRDNKGYSLTEILIVIAIIAILSAGTLGISGLVSNANTKKCAQSIFSDMARVKTNTLAKESGGTPPSAKNYFSLYRDSASNKIIIAEGVNGHVEYVEAGPRYLDVQYTYNYDPSGSTTWTDIPSESTPDTGGHTYSTSVPTNPYDEHDLTIEYDRTNGTIQEITGYSVPNAFRITNDKRTYVIVIHKHTGKTEFKME